MYKLTLEEIDERIQPKCYICGDKTMSIKDLQKYGYYHICNKCAKLVDEHIENLEQRHTAMQEMIDYSLQYATGGESNE